MGKKSDLGIKILKFSNANYLKHLEAAIRQGVAVMIENVGEELDPAIEPLLQKQVIRKGNTATLKIGDGIIEYNENFQFYLTTKLRNPHYLPEVSTKVTILNFMITYAGLSDQLLGIVVAKENPDLEDKKASLVRESAEIKRTLANTEAQILKTLNEVTDILGDDAAIQILENASTLSKEIEKKQEKAKITEKEIDDKRTEYQPVALKTAGLFFCVQDLGFIDPMYQYSLPFFINLFEMAIQQAEKSDVIEERLKHLDNQFLESLFKNICISVFEKDKMIFSFMLCLKLLELSKELDQSELKFLLTGGVSLGEDYGHEPAPWVDQKMWGELNRACTTPGLKNFIPHFKNKVEIYQQLYESKDPQNWEFPEDAPMMNPFRKLMIIRAIRPDKLVPSISNFIVDQIGEFYIKPPTFELANIFLDSRNISPLIFVLSAGSDPLQSLLKFAGTKNKTVDPISLGQGQGPKAEKQIENGIKNGDWVVLQNCHLAKSWMGQLEKICEDLQGDPRGCHRDFRLWLTSYPSEIFPQSILQNGVKMTREAKKGLSSNLQDSYGVDPISDPDWFNECSDSRKFRKLLFGLVFFHAVIQERRLYGPLGWNIRYEFNETDLRISVRQLKIFIEQYPEKTPFDALNYLVGECNYGGRVTDANDRITILTILRDYYTERIFSDDYKFSPSGKYFAPKHADHESYIEYARSLPQFPDPEVFGFHQNAAITKDLKDTNDMLQAVLLTKQDGGGGSGENQDEVATKLANTILEDIPDYFDLAEASKKYPVDYNQSLNSVLTQELERFNKLLSTIKQSLIDVKKAIKGEALLSIELEEALNQLILNQIPDMWLKKSFVSKKPLGSYVKDLKDRLSFMQTWLDNSIPEIFYINKFFFVHGFLTGAKQNYAREKKIPIDTMCLDFEVVRN